MELDQQPQENQQMQDNEQVLPQQQTQQTNTENSVNQNVNDESQKEVEMKEQVLQQQEQQEAIQQEAIQQGTIQAQKEEQSEQESEQQPQPTQQQIVSQPPNDSETQNEAMQVLQAEQAPIEQAQVEQVQSREQNEGKQGDESIDEQAIDEERMEQVSDDRMDKMDIDNDEDNDEDIDIGKKEILSSTNELLPELMECKNLLTEFMRRPETEPFNEPVDWKGLNLPDYPLIITKPMDLGTVLNKLTNDKYSNADQFATDIRLVFKNAKTYNTPGSGIYVVAENLHKQFERRFARITKNSISSKKRKSMDKIKNQQQSTFKDRVKFTNLIQTLMPQELGVIVEIIDKKSPMALNDGGKTNDDNNNNNNKNNNNNDDELEIEVYHIDAETLKHLISHCEKMIEKRNKKSRKK